MSSLTAVALALQLALGAYAPQQAGSAPLAPAEEARVQRLGKQLRCAVCQGLSIADSPASMARAQLDKVRALVSEGKTDEEIQSYFIARYGEWVLLSPPKHGLNWVVWAGPLVLILLGLGVVAKTIASGDPKAPGTTSGAAPDSAADPYLKAIRAELDR